MIRRLWPSLALSVVVAVTAFEVTAQMPLPGDPEATLSRAYPGATYSPYAQRSFPSRPLWGDSHLHTGLSVDAGLFGARLGLEDAYRFARGEEVISSTGQPVKLARPLDWLVIADHSDAMGFFDDLVEGAPQILASDEGKRWYDGLQAGGQASVDAASTSSRRSRRATSRPTFWRNTPRARRSTPRSGKGSSGRPKPTTIRAGSRALIGFEWTSLVNGNNLHRNVIFRDGADKAGQVVPFTTQAPIGSTDPLDLYEWLENYEATTGGSALALAHNGNLSNGLMFPVDAQYTGRALDAAYVEARAKWEPMYEVTQIKGDGETHPLLSPDDAFADYETWDAGNLDMSEREDRRHARREYAREALKNGLLLEERLGTNPYKFGMVGSTDSHTALTAVEEDNFFGKHAGSEPSPERMHHPFAQDRARQLRMAGSRWPRASPRSGRPRTPARRSSTRWRARRSTPPPGRA